MKKTFIILLFLILLPCFCFAHQMDNNKCMSKEEALQNMEFIIQSYFSMPDEFPIDLAIETIYHIGTSVKLDWSDIEMYYNYWIEPGQYSSFYFILDRYEQYLQCTDK